MKLYNTNLEHSLLEIIQLDSNQITMENNTIQIIHQVSPLKMSTFKYINPQSCFNDYTLIKLLNRKLKM